MGERKIVCMRVEWHSCVSHLRAKVRVRSLRSDCSVYVRFNVDLHVEQSLVRMLISLAAWIFSLQVVSV